MYRMPALRSRATAPRHLIMWQTGIRFVICLNLLLRTLLLEPGVIQLLRVFVCAPSGMLCR